MSPVCVDRRTDGAMHDQTEDFFVWELGLSQLSVMTVIAVTQTCHSLF